MLHDAQAPGYSWRTASAEGRHCDEATTSSNEADKHTMAGHGSRRRSLVLRDNAMQAPLWQNLEVENAPGAPPSGVTDSPIFLDETAPSRLPHVLNWAFGPVPGAASLLNFFGKSVQICLFDGRLRLFMRRCRSSLRRTSRSRPSGTNQRANSWVDALKFTCYLRA